MLSPSCSTVAILGVPFQNLTLDETVSSIEAHIRQGGFHQVATANVDFLRNALSDKHLRDILCCCEMVVPDGMPIVWMSRLIGTPLKERVTGIDLVERLADVSARRGYGIFLLGASESASHRVSRVLKQRYPSLRIVGRYSPEQQPIEKMDHEEILRRIEQAAPEILLVALGNPKQEQWIAMHGDRLKVPVCIGVGGTLDSLSGNVRRAPKWMQERGLEWLHRMMQEPRRLTLRYFADALCLLRHLPGYIAATATQPKRPRSPRLAVRQVGNTKLIATIGDICNSTLAEFNTCAEDAYLRGMNIVLDMSQAGVMGPEFLGSLIRLESRMRRHNEQLWLAEIPAHLARVLRSGRLHNYFTTTTMVSDALYRAAKAERRLLASFSPEWETTPRNPGIVDVRIEVLQEVCQRMITVEPIEKANRVPSVFADAIK